MEKSRAIELLKLAVPIKALTQQEYSDFVEAVNMGMDALEHPTTSDTISRQAALEALESQRTNDRSNTGFAQNRTVSECIERVRKLPSVQPVRETAKCIIRESCMDIGDADFGIKCAKCGAEYYHVEDHDYEYNFCPNCGRRWRRQDG